MIKTYLESLNNQTEENKNPVLTKNDVHNFGIIYTPVVLVQQILDLIPEKYFKDPKLHWLDIGAGTGAFSIVLYKRLFQGLQGVIGDSDKRHHHIITNMMYMVEIYPAHVEELHRLFGMEANIINSDFLSINRFEYPNFDFIIGNPPYNTGGKIKTPTDQNREKKEDGETTYVAFVKKSLEVLSYGGFLNLIIPNLWLKPDKSGLYNRLTNLNICKLHCLSAGETNKIFNYQAQTPTCFFLIENIEDLNDGEKSIKIWDKFLKKYIEYKLLQNWPIPCHGISIVNRLIKYVKQYGCLTYYKTNTCSKKISLSENNESEHDSEHGSKYKYCNIKTCYLNGLEPTLVYNWSDGACPYYRVPKLVLAHKMYGFPYLDVSGEYGISTRDNYVISGCNYSVDELQEIQAFLSTKFALFVFSTCNYRMRYLERYAFNFLPDIINMGNARCNVGVGGVGVGVGVGGGGVGVGGVGGGGDGVGGVCVGGVGFPVLKNIESRGERDIKIADFFGFSIEEREIIEKYSRDYKFFV